MIDIDSIDRVEKIRLLLQRRLSFVTIQATAVVALIGLVFANTDLSAQTLTDALPSFNYIRNAIIVIVLADLAVSGLWQWYRRLPRFASGETGLLVAIRTDTEKLRERVKVDFLESLQAAMRDVGAAVRIESLSEYHTEKLLSRSTTASKYHQRTRSRLIVVGKAVTRKHRNKDHYYIELNESVFIGPVADSAKDDMARKMGLYLPNRIMLDAGNELLSFRVHAYLFAYAAKYVLGMACAYANDAATALRFHRAVLLSRVRVRSEIPEISRSYEEMRSHTKHMVFRELEFLAKRAYIKGDRGKDVTEYLKEASQLGIESYEFHLLKSICLFEVRDLDGALEETRLARRLSEGDYTWAYNLGFLKAYSGDMAEADRAYRSAFRNRSTPDIHIQTESFIRRVLLEEPNRFQLRYFLGLIYYTMHEDLGFAAEQFAAFVEAAPDELAYRGFVNHAKRCLERIEGDKSSTVEAT